jgi:formate dehydrogenase accessory protein FdhE
MTIGRQKLSEYDKRIQRAEHLAAEYSFSAKLLKFYGQIARFQKELFAILVKECSGEMLSRTNGDLRTELNLMVLLPKYPNFLALVEANAPQPLGAAARELSREGSASWIELLSAYWADGGKADEENMSEAGEGRTALQEFLAQGFLQAYAEFVGEAMAAPAAEGTAYICPKCSSLPLLGVLRPEGDGGKRFLRCAFCAHEWSFRRILCPACGEEREEKLPVYVAEQFPHVRVESCDTCQHYLRTIDLTKDGNAVPEADDLAAIPLTLWAQEHGYLRIHTNLLGA